MRHSLKDLWEQYMRHSLKDLWEQYMLHSLKDLWEQSRVALGFHFTDVSATYIQMFSVIVIWQLHSAKQLLSVPSLDTSIIYCPKHPLKYLLSISKYTPPIHLLSIVKSMPWNINFQLPRHSLKHLVSIGKGIPKYLSLVNYILWNICYPLPITLWNH